MDILYYFRQWPGGFTANLARMMHVVFLECRRMVTGRPYIAEFDLTDSCNLSCTHCYHFRENNKLDYSQLDAETWHKKFLSLKQQGIRRVLLIGGEPALRPDVIDKAMQVFAYVDVCSNGTIKVEARRHMQPKLFVSVDGKRATHDALRGAGVFDKVLSNYTNDKRVVFSMTLTKSNLPELEEVVQLAISAGVAGVSCDMYTPSPENPQDDPMFIAPEQRIEMINTMRRLKKKYPRHFLMSHSAINWFLKTDHKGAACYWRQAVLHFNTRLEQRNSCKDLDCGNCGHFAQANLSPLNFLI